MLDDPAKRLGSGVDGMLAGYVMLKPKEGWDYTCDILKDGKKEFMFRYAALRAVRFLWDSRPDLVSKKELKEGMGLLLDQSDIADLAIDDLRKRECWDMADRVLGSAENARLTRYRLCAAPFCVSPWAARTTTRRADVLRRRAAQEGCADGRRRRGIAETGADAAPTSTPPK